MRGARRRPPRLFGLRAGTPAQFAVFALLLGLVAGALHAAEEDWDARDRRLIDAALAAMPAQRPGEVDLYVVGMAGDGQEDVFRNEVLHLERTAAQRLGNGGRTVTLVNHPDALEPATERPLATLAGLRHALAGVGRAMDPDEDVLLLFLTTHGSEDHHLAAILPQFVDEEISPAELREALDASGIRHRVVVVSACFSGGFIPTLSDPDTLVITAARADRPSFGCGVDAELTYFGGAWLIDGLNRKTDFVAAYKDAARAIAKRERTEGFPRSHPQIAQGARIGTVLQRWRETSTAGAAVAFDPPPPMFGEDSP